MIRSDPPRAVVAPPHLHAKTSGFYARVHWLLRAGQRGQFGNWQADFPMQIYAPRLCSRASCLC